MNTNKNTELRQVTCIQHEIDNAEHFNRLFKFIVLGHAKDVIYEMLTWAESDLESIQYDVLLHLAKDYNESIVYDDFNYILTASDDIIVLYQRIG